MSVSAISSAGSGENLKLMDEDQIQFGILQGLYGAYAWNGSGPVPKAYKNLRSVSMLWQNVEHFVVTRKVTKTGTIEDMTNLYGENFSIGARNSGTEGSGRLILGKVGTDLKKVNRAYQGYGPSADALAPWADTGRRSRVDNFRRCSGMEQSLWKTSGWRPCA